MFRNYLPNPIHRLYLSFLLLLAVLGFGIIGYMVLEDFTLLEAVYMTVITVSTVGFTEIRPLSDTGRIFTIILILGNIGIFTYLISQISGFFLDGELKQYLKILNMKQNIEKLENHVILCGYGRTGHEAALILKHHRTPFVVIEKNLRSAELEHLPTPFYLNADATKDETLLEAGITKAKALITTLPDDTDNVFVALTARELNASLHIISRSSLDSSVKKLIRAGANNVIMPDKIGGAHMATLLVKPDLAEFFEIISTRNTNDFQVMELRSNCKKTILEIDAWNLSGATILGVKKLNGEYVLNPEPACWIEPGFGIIVMGSSEQIERLKKLIS